MGAILSKTKLSVDIHAKEGDKYASIKSVCKKLLPGWKDLNDGTIEITCVSGGISNALYKVTPPEPLEAVVFRIYGDNTEKFVDRSKELKIMPILNSHGFGPKLLGTFSNGRIESFLTGMRCMTPEEVSQPDFIPQIASAMATYHNLPMPGHQTKDNNVATPFARLREWLNIAKTLNFDDAPEKNAIYKTFDFATLMAEVDAVEAVAKLVNSPIVFSHCDLLPGNIMVAEDSTSSSNKLTFIDFEYADWAPRGFDLGNHFCEYAGFDCDYSKYPGTEAASVFVREYIKSNSTSNSNDDKEVERMVAEANVYALTAHMYWGSWGMMQARWSSIDFDYMGYAALRWGEFHKRKDEFLSSARQLFEDK